MTISSPEVGVRVFKKPDQKVTRDESHVEGRVVQTSGTPCLMEPSELQPRDGKHLDETSMCVFKHTKYLCWTIHVFIDLPPHMSTQKQLRLHYTMGIFKI